MRKTEALQALARIIDRIGDATMVAVLAVDDDGVYSITADAGEDMAVVALGIRGRRRKSDGGRGVRDVEAGTLLRDIEEMR